MEIRRTRFSESSEGNMEHDLNVLRHKISRYFVSFQKSKTNVIRQPAGSFSDESFHVWETQLGVTLAEHITNFRNETILIINEKTAKINQYVASKTANLIAVDRTLDQYQLSDFKRSIEESTLEAAIDEVLQTLPLS